ncbi:DNA repair exonuclease [Lagierella sp.]|uniref:metallophosphoesterase family protein n=1 Tax=Lagierella sp. TaxID=2849657 RepID=UPI00262EA39F|nr:DNA repair exonuclease [Lagierella sp.]
MKINKFTFLHSGDFHLGSNFYSSDLPIELVESRRENIWTSIESLFAIAKDEEIDCIFLCGDIYNEDFITLSQLERLNSLFKTVPSTKIFIIFGNHDPYNDNSKFKYIKLPSNVFVFKEDNLTCFSFDNVNIYGISYKDRILYRESYFDNLNLNQSSINILMLHTDILIQNSNYMGLTLYDLKKLGFDYIALGHIHKPQNISNNIIYPGSIEPLSFSETGTHGIVYGEFEGRKLRTKFIPISESIFTNVEFKIENNFDFYKLLNFLREEAIVENKENYLRLYLTGRLDSGFEIDTSSLEKALRKYVTYVQVFDETEDNYDIEKILELNKEDQIGIFIEKVRKLKVDKEIKDKVLDYGLTALLREDS